MHNLNEMFGIPAPTSEEVEEAKQQKFILDEMTSIFFKLAKESKAGKNFTSDVVAEILQNLNMEGHKKTPLGQVIELLGDAFSRVQGGNRPSTVEAALQNLCMSSTTTPLEKRIFQQMLENPELFSWIKTSNV